MKHENQEGGCSMNSESEPTKHGKILQILDLSPEQQRAVHLVISGKTDNEIAEELGVCRATVNTWRNRCAPFVAAVNQERLSIWQASKSKITRLAGKALNLIERSLDDGEIATAWRVLELCPGIFEDESPEHLPTDPGEILFRQQQEAAEAQGARMWRLFGGGGPPGEFSALGGRAGPHARKALGAVRMYLGGRTTE
jgi:hypothetical protein